MASLGSSMCGILLSSNNDSLASSSPVWIPFTSFSSLIAVARTSRTMLNKNGASEHLGLVSDLRGKAFSFSPLSMILALS